MRKGDGSTFWCRLEGKALDAATPMGVSIWIWEDITERKRAETDIRSAKAFLDSVIDMSPIATWIAGTLPCAAMKAASRASGSTCASFHKPRSPRLIRPSGSTAVASTMISPAPPTARLP